MILVCARGAAAQQFAPLAPRGYRLHRGCRAAVFGEKLRMKFEKFIN
jgi:hypothetical protein